MKYKSGYKYQLAENYRVQIGIKGHTISQGPIKLTVTGHLTMKKGYAWDGPTWAIDTKNFMRGSLVHDALYQLMRMRRLDWKVYRDLADRLLQSMCIEDGMWKIRAWWVYRSLALFGESASNPANQKEVLEAP